MVQKLPAYTRFSELLLPDKGETVITNLVPSLDALLVAPEQLCSTRHVAAFGDIDNNGTIDVVVANNNGPARLLLNGTTPRGHWLEVRLQGTKSVRDGIGTRVTVLRPGRPPLVKRAHTDGSYLSAGDIRVHFGLADSTQATVIAEWPGGLREKWENVRVDSEVVLREGTGVPVA